jgi:serine/threonine protein kinase
MAQSLPSHIPIEEETIPGYNPKYFYHPDPGDVLDGRYELKAKVGFGTTSTVWMAQDLRSPPEAKAYVAIKICTSNVQDATAAQHELEMSKRIVDCAHGDEMKYQTLLTVNGSFEIVGRHGPHLCLVMDLMREPIWLMRRRLCGGDKATAKTIVCFKLYVLEILAGLQHLHDGCNIIHTGKPHHKFWSVS